MPAVPMLPAAMLAAALAAAPAAADTVVAARTLRAAEVIGAQDVEVIPGDTPGAAATLAAVVGMETRVILYAGRPIRRDQIGPPALVERNQLVALVFAAGGLRIETGGRALERAAAGEAVRVMNLGSRRTVTGLVGADGRITVGAEGR